MLHDLMCMAMLGSRIVGVGMTVSVIMVVSRRSAVRGELILELAHWLGHFSRCERRVMRKRGVRKIWAVREDAIANYQE